MDDFEDYGLEDEEEEKINSSIIYTLFFYCDL